MNITTRDFTGHGADPPDAAWRGGARISVQSVLNFYGKQRDLRAASR